MKRAVKLVWRLVSNRWSQLFVTTTTEYQQRQKRYISIFLHRHSIRLYVSSLVHTLMWCFTNTWIILLCVTHCRDLKLLIAWGVNRVWLSTQLQSNTIITTMDDWVNSVCPSALTYVTVIHPSLQYLNTTAKQCSIVVPLHSVEPEKHAGLRSMANS